MKVEINGFLFNVVNGIAGGTVTVTLFDLQSQEPLKPLFEENVTGNDFFHQLSVATYWMTQRKTDRDEDKETFFAKYTERQLAFIDSPRCDDLRNLSWKFDEISDNFPAMKFSL